MSWLSRLLGREAKAAITSSAELAAVMRGEDGPLTWKAALEVAAVMACVRVIAQGVAQVPFGLYQDVSGQRGPAKDNPLHQLLHRRPNRWQTSYEYRETQMIRVLLMGNAYAFVNRVGRAREVREIVPLDPENVSVKQMDDGDLEYRVTMGGQQKVFGSDAIWHLRGPSVNGWEGLGAVRQARVAIGLTRALEKGQLDFQRGGARTSGMLSVTQKLSAERFEQLAAWIDKHAPDGTRFAKPMILDDGATYTPFVMTGVDQQLIENRKMQVEEICRAFGVMPIMVGQSDKAATYASAEQMFLAHVVHTLSPWYARIEQSAEACLLTDEDRAAGRYVKFNANALMRGAAKDRAEFYAKGLGSGGSTGWLTPNDVRRLEDMDPLADPEADKLPKPAAQAVAAKPAKEAGDDGED